MDGRLNSALSFHAVSGFRISVCFNFLVLEEGCEGKYNPSFLARCPDYQGSIRAIGRQTCRFHCHLTKIINKSHPSTSER